MDNGLDKNKLKWAVPSWVLPGTIIENVIFLTASGPGFCLFRFETEASLAYGEEDLPAWLASRGLQWHVHLPADLPWNRGASHVAHICNTLYNKIAQFNPATAILHPPKRYAKKLLEEFRNLPRFQSRLKMAGGAIFGNWAETFWKGTISTSVWILSTLFTTTRKGSGIRILHLGCPLALAWPGFRRSA